MKFSVDIKELNLNTAAGKLLLLKDINFEITEGKIYVILGKNGSGKSTLIKSFTSLLNKDFYEVKGSVSWNGNNILAMKEKELTQFRREKIKYVFQDAKNSFDPLKKLGYYFKRFKIDKQETEELLDNFLLPSFDKIKRMYPWELSGGMAQRFSITVALSLHPELLILDEPTSGIDAPITNLILLKLKEFVSTGKGSVLLVTQDLYFAEKGGDVIAHIKDKTISTFTAASEYSSSAERLFDQ